MGRLLGLIVFSATLLQAQDRIFFHAKIFTADPQSPYAEAVAIRGDKILAIGNLPDVADRTLDEFVERAVARS